jgi:2-haloacid dehalogenase
MVMTAPSVLVFDVNETLLDIESMAPFFGRIFGDPQVLREWFGQLVMYSMTVTLSGHYVDYITLGQGLLRMLADIHHVNITDDDVRAVREGMLTMPAHPDARDALTALRDSGFRLCDPDKFSAVSRRPHAARTRRAGRLFRAAIQRRCLPCL